MNESLSIQMMQRSFDLARQGQGHVEPNPMVGAVVVQGDRIIGEGWHQTFGGPHAEIHALREAGQRANGARLYVTLEPCCHYGKTPPCTDAIIQAGIKHVVAACPDPNPQVAGQGIATLRKAGIEVEVGLLQEQAESLNAPFFKLIQTGLPYVIAKWAMTLDGRLATQKGDSKWISCEESRQRVHQLRGRVDAIIVGLGTVLFDDPLLTARPPGARIAARIVLDTELQTPTDKQLVQSAKEVPTLIAHSSTNQELIDTLQKLGCECLSVGQGSRSERLMRLLSELGRRGMTNVLVEGGSHVLGSFFDSWLVDEVWVFVAPKWVGSTQAISPILGVGFDSMAQAGRLQDVVIEQSGVDAFIHGRCVYPNQSALQ